MTLLLVLLVGVGIGMLVPRRTPRLPELRDPMVLVVEDLTPLVHEPWRETHPDAVEVPLAALRAVAQPEDLQRARSCDRPRLLARQIAQEGLRQPLELRFDRQGRVVLGDGHNRLVSAEVSGRPTLPAVARTVPKLPAYGVPVERFYAGLKTELPAPG